MEQSAAARKVLNCDDRTSNSNQTFLTHMTTTESKSRPIATKVVAERIRKLGDVALRSIGDIARHQRVHDNDAPSLTPEAMLTDLLANNQELIKYLRARSLGSGGVFRPTCAGAPRAA
jgi:DNA-binding ferritin-like protein